MTLPAAAKEPRREVSLSSDPALRTCVHEIARALEEYARKEYVPLFATTADFESAAIEIASRLSAEKCPLKS